MPDLERRLVALPSGTFQEVQMFSDASLQRAIEAVTAALPQGSSGAVIRVGPHESGFNVALGLRGNHWSVEAAWGMREGAPDDWSAQAIVSW